MRVSQLRLISDHKFPGIWYPTLEIIALSAPSSGWWTSERNLISLNWKFLFLSIPFSRSQKKQTWKRPGARHKIFLKCESFYFWNGVIIAKFILKFIFCFLNRIIHMYTHYVSHFFSSHRPGAARWARSKAPDAEMPIDREERGDQHPGSGLMLCVRKANFSTAELTRLSSSLLWRMLPGS